VEPPPVGLPPVGLPAEPGAPGELPEDVLATDAGLTELPADVLVPGRAAGGAESVGAPTGPEVIDDALVAELLAEAPADTEVIVVEESDFEEAVADAAAADASALDAAAADAEPTDAERAAPEPADAERAAPEPTDAELAAPEPTDAELAAPGVTDAEPVWTAAEDEPMETELVAPELGVDEPASPVARGAVAHGDEESSIRIPMPTFSEAPTMEIPAVTDNLRAVRGIGPSMERMLHGLGIISFRQLAMLDGAELERVRGELSDFRSRIEREDWVGQARELHRTKYGRDPS
jgi:predicted flap endonuclease-1-like 5' DNA nuclease